MSDQGGDNRCALCGQVRMKDQHTEEELKFVCQRWMSRDEDDCEICREMPVYRDGEPLRPGTRTTDLDTLLISLLSVCWNYSCTI